jgi:hypothetical protein
LNALRALVVGSLVLAGAGPAHAALLSLLGSSTLDLRLGPYGETVTFDTLQCGPVTMPGIAPFPMNQPVSLLPLGPGGGFVEPAGLFSGTRTFDKPFSVPTTFGFPCTFGIDLLDDFTLANVSNGTKSIAPGAAGGGQATGVVRPGGGLGGPGALAGTAIVNVLGLFNLNIPLSPIGSTGDTGQVVAGTLAITVLGTGWTTASVRVTGVSTLTPGGNVLNTVTFAGYDNRTPGHVGTVLLVSPFKVLTNAAGNLPGIARQTLVFGGVVPEPGVLLLLTAGAAALGLRGRRRAAKRR